MKPAVIVAAHSRAASLRRLLRALATARYPDRDVKIVISIDGGGPDEVAAVARSFSFPSGSVDVIERSENLGLRNHILWCGEQSLKYGAVVVLEDDLLVDPQFYMYAQAALRFYADEHRVAGVALYGAKFNEDAGLPFEPMDNGFSAFPMQVACSWGQAWSAEQWARFKQWYESSAEDGIQHMAALPQTVKGWPATSWKKFFAAYLVCSDTFVMYPYRAYSTNCAAPGGVHMPADLVIYHVPLAYEGRADDNYLFHEFDLGHVVYDAFMEPCGRHIEAISHLETADVEFDFYGRKPIDLLLRKDYCVTTKNVRSACCYYPIRFKPIERNLAFANGNPAGLCAALARSTDVRGGVQLSSYYRLAQYYSFFPIASKRLAVGLCQEMAQALAKKGRAWRKRSEDIR